MLAEKSEECGSRHDRGDPVRDGLGVKRAFGSEKNGQKNCKEHDNPLFGTWIRTGRSWKAPGLSSHLQIHTGS